MFSVGSYSDGYLSLVTKGVEFRVKNNIGLSSELNVFEGHIYITVDREDYALKFDVGDTFLLLNYQKLFILQMVQRFK